MKLVKKISKGILIFLLIPVLYFLMAFLFSYITVAEKLAYPEKDQSIYLHTNGVHLDIILPKELISDDLLKGLNHKPSDQYFSFGWGDHNFYLNTPNWSDLTLSTGFSAMFLKSSTLMHVSRYRGKASDAVEIKLSETQLVKLNQHLLNTFMLDEEGNKKILAGRGYAYYDDFFEAKGNYSCFNTCNSWVNALFKASDIKARFWTPFDFPLMDLYKK